MTAPLKQYVVVPETIHHAPVHVTVTPMPDPYPVNPRWPPDPAIYGQAVVYDCVDLDEGRGR